MPLRVTLLTSAELSHHPPTVQDNFQQLLAASLRKKVTGADLYATAITLRQFLTGKSVYRDPRFTAKHCQSGSSQFHIKLFGSYLHNISHHAPLQIEISLLEIM